MLDKIKAFKHDAEIANRNTNSIEELKMWVRAGNKTAAKNLSFKVEFVGLEDDSAFTADVLSKMVREVLNEEIKISGVKTNVKITKIGNTKRSDCLIPSPDELKMWVKADCLIPDAVKEADALYIELKESKHKLTKLFHDLTGEDSVDAKGAMEQLDKALENMETMLQRYA